MNYSIIDSATYLVKKFKDNNKELLELKLEGMLYFAEAFYIAKNDKKNLFKEEWLVSPFGPRNISVYNKFKNNGLPINFKKINTMKANKISTELAKYLDSVYETFKDIPAADLVDIARSDGSPWSKAVKNMTGIEILYNEKETVPKEETKKWI